MKTHWTYVINDEQTIFHRRNLFEKRKRYIGELKDNCCNIFRYIFWYKILGCRHAIDYHKFFWIILRDSYCITFITVICWVVMLRIYNIYEIHFKVVWLFNKFFFLNCIMSQTQAGSIRRVFIFQNLACRYRFE